MSLSGALSNAISGLNAATRSAQVVSSNLANVMTDGYGRRGLELESRNGSGGGVNILSTVRFRDPSAVAEMRSANSERSAQSSLSDFFSKLETLVGTPDSANSLTSKLAALESSFVSAASRPDVSGRLDQVVRDAQSVTRALNTASQGTQDARMAADRNIALGVKELNSMLVQVQELNVQIGRGSARRHDVSALVDARENLIGEISEWVPVKEMRRPNEGIALYTSGGALLLDGGAAELSFTNAHTIVPHMTLQGGHLSGIAINGTEVSVEPQGGALRGGKLGALFEVRDSAAVSAQSELDALARDLGERFQAAGLDATRAAGDPGVFTDGGAFVDPANEVGLAGRLSVNAALDPSQGGASWRLRDGVGASVTGPVGDASLLQAFSSALNERRDPLSGSFAGQAQSASALAGNISGKFGADRLDAEQNLTFAAMRATAAESAVMADGVDSDQEIQNLMMIEQAYAANARVLQTVDEMIDTLMGVV